MRFCGILLGNRVPHPSTLGKLTNLWGRCGRQTQAPCAGRPTRAGYPRPASPRRCGRAASIASTSPSSFPLMSCPLTALRVHALVRAREASGSVLPVSVWRGSLLGSGRAPARGARWPPRGVEAGRLPGARASREVPSSVWRARHRCGSAYVRADPEMVGEAVEIAGCGGESGVTGGLEIRCRPCGRWLVLTCRDRYVEAIPFALS